MYFSNLQKSFSYPRNILGSEDELFTDLSRSMSYFNQELCKWDNFRNFVFTVLVVIKIFWLIYSNLYLYKKAVALTLWPSSL